MKHEEIAYCIFDYMYRDGSNYKAWGSLLLSGTPLQEDITALKACLESGEYFASRLCTKNCGTYQEAPLRTTMRCMSL